MDLPLIPLAYRKRAKGALIVKAARSARLGVSDTHIPEGAIGFVQASTKSSVLVDWPWLKQTGAMNRDDLIVVGRQPLLSTLQPRGGLGKQPHQSEEKLE